MLYTYGAAGPASTCSSPCTAISRIKASRRRILRILLHRRLDHRCHRLFRRH